MWQKKWEIDIKFGVFKFKEIRKRLESFSLEKIRILCNKSLPNEEKSVLETC